MIKLEVIKMLEEMRIVENYLELAVKHQVPKKETYDKYDNKIVLSMIEGMGYEVKYNKKENFFKVSFEDIGPIKLQLNLVFKYGMVDMIWCAWNCNELLIGSPMTILINEIKDENYKITRPMFRDYDDLQEILNRTFHLFNEFVNQIKLQQG